MTRLERYANLVAVIVPFAAFLGAIALLWNEYVAWSDLVILAVMYLTTAIGVTVGYHRLFTHRAFDAVAPVRYTLAVLGSMAVQGPVIDWVADHRTHPASADDDGDPHSPHGHGSGLRGAMKGLYYAHMGWLSVTQGQAEKRRFAPDLLEDSVLRKISRSFLWLLGAGLVIPALLGYALTGGTLKGALTGYLWGGLVRIF